ncbi:MAG: succinate dehydrogenase [Bacteroidota bacterium]
MDNNALHKFHREEDPDGAYRLFLISFLIVHASINALIFFNDGGMIFTMGAHFMATNVVIRTIEIFLVIGFVLHIIQGLLLWRQNRNARGEVRYDVVTQPMQVTWYSRSMTLLGTLLLLFLVIHTSNFWIPNRVNQFRTGEELPLYAMMLTIFQKPIEVIIYLFGVGSLFWHLLHGFRSSLQTLGLNHPKYNNFFTGFGVTFSVVICSVFAAMPVSIYFGLLTL